MSTLKQEFIKAAKETPRMFFAPLIGAYKAVVGEFEESGRRKKKKKDKKAYEGFRVVYVRDRSFRHMRNVAKRAHVENVVRINKKAEQDPQDPQDPQDAKC